MICGILRTPPYYSPISNKGGYSYPVRRRRKNFQDFDLQNDRKPFGNALKTPPKTQFLLYFEGNIVKNFRLRRAIPTPALLIVLIMKRISQQQMLNQFCEW